MNSELRALEEQNIWTLMPLPVDKRPIACKWVYRIKYSVDGNVEWHKARLVVKGFTQVEGINFNDSFS